MTPRSLILTLLASVLALSIIGVVLYRAGEQRGQSNTKIAALQAHQDEQHAVELAKQASADSLKRLRDSAAKLTEALDSVRRLRAAASARALTVASLTRKVATLDSASVTITSDSGPATYTVAVPVAHQWALERAADQAAIGTLTAQVAADSESITSRDAQLAHAAQRDSVRDEVDAALHAQLADADSTVALLKQQRAPRFTFTEGVITGVLAAAAAHAALLLLF